MNENNLTLKKKASSHNRLLVHSLMYLLKVHSRETGGTQKQFTNRKNEEIGWVIYSPGSICMAV